MNQTLAFTDQQLERIRAAAATVRVSSRDLFLQTLAQQLSRCRHVHTDRDVARAISVVLGVTPVEGIRSEIE
jgi:hypothetical protein